jgi:hypothetical protein
MPALPWDLARFYPLKAAQEALDGKAHPLCTSEHRLEWAYG